MGLIKSFPFACKSMRLAFSFGIGMFSMCLTGCSEGHSECSETSRIEKNVTDQLARIPDVLTNGEVNVFVDSIVSNISSFALKEKQVEWYWKSLGKVFSADISRFNYRCQFRSFCLISELWSGISAGLSEASEKTWVDRWRLRLNDLTWKKRQLSRLKKEYAELEPATKTNPIPYSIQKKAYGLKGLINSIQVNVWGQIDRFERWYIEEKSQMSEEEYAQIGDMFMETLGRKLRSLEQIEVDRRKRNEKFLKEDKNTMSNTNHPPLILIDATK